MYEELVMSTYLSEEPLAAPLEDSFLWESAPEDP